MTLLYIFLGGVVAYCLFQSLRFRMATWQHRSDRPDLGRMASAFLTSDEERSERYMEEAFLTGEGRKLLFKHRMYDLAGILAALAFLLLWLDERGILDRILG